MNDFLEKPLWSVLEELGKSNAAFKFSVCNGEARIAVDGFMDSLNEKRVLQKTLKKIARQTKGGEGGESFLFI